MVFTTPFNLPVMQPYRQTRKAQIQTVLQRITVRKREKGRGGGGGGGGRGRGGGGDFLGSFFSFVYYLFISYFFFLDDSIFG